MANLSNKIVTTGASLNWRVKLVYQISAWVLVLSTTFGTVFAFGLAWQNGIGVLEVGLFGFMYALSVIGITVGYHRLFSHRAFDASMPVQVILAVLGALACQGPLIYWVSIHRRHHQFSDQSGDPHSPYADLEHALPPFKGFWHAHMGWIFRHDLTNTFRFSKDLLQDPVLSKVNRLYPVWVVLSLALPAFLGGLFSQTWDGAFLGFLWGGLVRIFLVAHMTYSVNSVCHFFGSRAFDTKENSTNNIWLAIPTGGEAWHNNHHAFPSSAKFGLKFWQIDIGYIVVYFLKLLGLAHNVKVPSQTALEKRRKETI